MSIRHLRASRTEIILSKLMIQRATRTGRSGPSSLVGQPRQTQILPPKPSNTNYSMLSSCVSQILTDVMCSPRVTRRQIPTPSLSASNTSIPQPSRGLSSGNKAAIGVGAVLRFILISVLVWLAFWYGRRTTKKNEKSPPGDPSNPATHQAVARPFPPSYSPEASRAMSPDLGTLEQRQVVDLDARANTIVRLTRGHH
jgi:hypothetical protein